MIQYSRSHPDAAPNQALDQTAACVQCGDAEPIVRR